jgi:hypothetical protein
LAVVTDGSVYLKIPRPGDAAEPEPLWRAVITALASGLRRRGWRVSVSGRGRPEERVVMSLNGASCGGVFRGGPANRALAMLETAAALDSGAVVFSGEFKSPFAPDTEADYGRAPFGPAEGKRWSELSDTQLRAALAYPHPDLSQGHRDAIKKEWLKRMRAAD